MEPITELENRTGRILREIRLNRGISQKELARLSDLSVSTVANLERGRGASLQTFLRAVRALDRLDFLDSLDEGLDGPTPMQLLRASESTRKGPRRAPRKALG